MLIPPYFRNASLLLFILLSACSSGTPAESTSVPNDTQPSVEAVTEVPAAIALVNGEAISDESFGRHLGLYENSQATSGTVLATGDAGQTVIDDLIARLLLAQAARAEGFVADEALVNERIAKLIEDAGGQVVFDEWLSTHGYDTASFREDLSLEIEAGWMRNEITSAVASEAEQVEARQILLSELFQAERLLAQLQAGTPFETVVINNDPQRLGTLGWFPRGYLLQVEVEEAAFALQPGEFSEIVESELGFHLIEVLNRDPARALNPQARLQWQLQALEDWVAARVAESDIEVFLP
jgi:peptidyl-prolyl cis-trans isomerase C